MTQKICEWDSQAYSNIYYYVDIKWADYSIQTHKFPRTPKGLEDAFKFKQNCLNGVLKQGNPNYGVLCFYGPYTVDIIKNVQENTNE